MRVIQLLNMTTFDHSLSFRYSTLAHHDMSIDCEQAIGDLLSLQH